MTNLNSHCGFCSQVFAIKEGVSYRIRIDFLVQREIVHGLKYVQKTSRLGVPGRTDFYFDTPILDLYYPHCSLKNLSSNCNSPEMAQDFQIPKIPSLK